MRIKVPQVEYPVVKFTVTHSQGTEVAWASSHLREIDITLPEGVREEQCGVVAEMCAQGSVPDPKLGAIVLKAPMPPDVQPVQGPVEVEVQIDIEQPAEVTCGPQIALPIVEQPVVPAVDPASPKKR